MARRVPREFSTYPGSSQGATSASSSMRAGGMQDSTVQQQQQQEEQQHLQQQQSDQLPSTFTKPPLQDNTPAVEVRAQTRGWGLAEGIILLDGGGGGVLGWCGMLKQDTC